MGARQIAETRARAQELQMQDSAHKHFIEEYRATSSQHAETERRLARFEESAQAQRKNDLAGIGDSLQKLKDETPIQLQACLSSLQSNWRCELLEGVQAVKRDMASELQEVAEALQRDQKNNLHVLDETTLQQYKSQFNEASNPRLDQLHESIQELQFNLAVCKSHTEQFDAEWRKEAQAYADSLRPLQVSVEELQSDLKTHTHELHFDMAHSPALPHAMKPMAAGAGASAVRSLSMASPDAQQAAA